MTKRDLTALVALLNRTPMSEPEYCFAMWMVREIAKLAGIEVEGEAPAEE